MELLYISRLCSDEKFTEIFKGNRIKPQQQEQKFHKLLVKGLQQYCKKIHALAVVPFSEKDKTKLWCSIENEKYENISFKYLSLKSIIVLKHFVIFFWSLYSALRWIRETKAESKIIVCDVLNLSMTMGALLASKLSGTRIVGIVTDLPEYMQSYTKHSNKGFRDWFINIYRILSNLLITKYDAYIILTEQMNQLVNPKQKPSIVIEGMVDEMMSNHINKIELKYEQFIILYAGALHEKYGIMKLAMAFNQIQSNNLKLWIFGSGDMEGEIRRLEGLDARIKFWGVVANDLVVEAETRATLLINPRPSDEVFTQYSFPSKNMEYMVSGTPLLTTRLPGMPTEYNEFVYLLEDESIEGISMALQRLTLKGKDSLHAKGAIAKEFVLKFKNNRVQAKKVFDLLEEVVGPVVPGQ